jgi:thioredoxin 1
MQENFMEIEFTDTNFKEQVLKSEKPVLVDFWAPWCGPCQSMGPVISELVKAYEGRVKVGKINVDENHSTAEKYAVMSIPSIKIFKKGEVVKEFVGMQNIEVLKEELEKISG